jgi:hypothetical protein
MAAYALQGMLSVKKWVPVSCPLTKRAPDLSHIGWRYFRRLRREYSVASGPPPQQLATCTAQGI